ncbi:MAG: hypothetical protein J0H31_16875, partial [Alphaproteobacteria bacterium]|nr:hypothetical protein [Alphaproteobacteria bacterium]
MRKIFRIMLTAVANNLGEPVRAPAKAPAGVQKSPHLSRCSVAGRNVPATFPTILRRNFQVEARVRRSRQIEPGPARPHIDRAPEVGSADLARS